MRRSIEPGPEISDSTRVNSPVAVGMSVLVDTAKADWRRVAVGLGDYAEATAITPTEILVNGKTAGETTMIIWGARRYAPVHQRRRPSRHGVGFEADHLDTIRAELATEFARTNPQDQCNADNGTIFLRVARSTI